MIPTTFSLFKIRDTDNFGFLPENYSRFKFGDEAIAKQFGIQLAKGFIKQISLSKFLEKQIVVISSPYCFIPTATFAMKNYFIYEINRWLSANSFQVVQEAKIHRTVTYMEDYGEMDAFQRYNLISKDSFYVDSSFLKDKALIFMDDIKITGSHERMIIKMMQDNKLVNDAIMIYYAELINKNIHPNIENYLNYYFIKTVFELQEIIDSGRFIMNTRVVKYILNVPHQQFKIFIDNQSSEFINMLYDLAIGNSYHTIQAYMANLHFLKKFILYNQNQTTYGN